MVNLTIQMPPRGQRAQVGLCLSRFADPEPTSAHVTSLVRGRLHLEALDKGASACAVQGLVDGHLKKIADDFPNLIGGARGQGYAFAFDLPSPEHMRAYIGQRFRRGTVVFAAGTRTIRYRLSAAYGAFEIKQLFKTVRATLEWLTEYPDLDGPLPEPYTSHPGVFRRWLARPNSDPSRSGYAFATIIGNRGSHLRTSPPRYALP